MGLQVDIRKKLHSYTLDMTFSTENQALGLLGASGCGKSMTLRCVAGIETPDEGRIVLDDHVLFDSDAGINVAPQHRNVGMLFQNYQLFPHYTVEKNIMAGVAIKDPVRRGQILEELLKAFKLTSVRDKYPKKLSGGQQQRVALARMLAPNPRVLLLDEPFSALDSYLKDQLEQDLASFLDCYDKPALYVSHDMDEAYRFCRTIAVVDEGTIAEMGPSERIVREPGTLATMRLSACRNASSARKLDDHRLEAIDWGLILQSQRPIPDDLGYVGVRALAIRPAQGQDHNVVAGRVTRVSDSRYERTATVSVASCPTGERAPLIQWSIDKMRAEGTSLPQEGDAVSLYLQPESLYLVTR